MMGRAVGIITLALTVLGVPLAADAQQPAKVLRIGFLRAEAPPESYINAFRQGLRELGYVEGQNVTIEYRWAEGKFDRLPALAAELVRLKVDVIEPRRFTFHELADRSKRFANRLAGLGVAPGKQVFGKRVKR